MPTVVGDTYATGIVDASSAFPSFDVHLNGTNVPSLNYLTFADIDTRGTYLGRAWDGTYRGGTRGGLPLVLYDRNNTALVLSPLDNFLQSILASNRGNLAFGMNGKTAHVPRRYNVSFLLYASNRSVNDALRGWGDLLLVYYRKARTAIDQNLSLQKLGYATDNGAFYYYLTEKGKTYEETLLDLESYFNETKLPVAYLMLDSWWYPKADDGGCLLWEPMKSVFPNGMSVLGKPLWLHSRYFSPQSPYKDKYDFASSDSTSHPCLLPLDDAFFRDIMQTANAWPPHPAGMIVYEQDWMAEVMKRMNYTYSEPTAAERWLQAMNAGAESTNASLQWDTAYPSQIMFSVAVSRVTQGSAGFDYQPGSSQWDDALHDLLFDAVGLVPWKDTFWTTEYQPGCPSSYSTCREPNPELQTLVSLLSTGPVSPGDAIGRANVSLLKRTCMSDGTLLKPDRPLLPMSRVFVESFETLVWPRVLVTEAQPFTQASADHLIWYYILAADLKADFVVYPDDLADGMALKSLVAVQLMSVDGENGLSDDVKVIQFSNDHPLKIAAASAAHNDSLVSFTFYLISQRLASGHVLLGELAKLVPLSRQRVYSVDSHGSSTLDIGLRGVINEKVVFSLIQPNSTEVDSVECLFADEESMTIECESANCKCKTVTFSRTI